MENGSGLVNKSGETLREIVGSVKRVTDIVAEIAAASQEQSVGVEQVNKAMTQMDQVTQTNASQTEEMSSTAEGLSTQAAQLQVLVGRFTLDEGGGAFYGPKISVQAKDAIGRTHQLSTIQLDFQTPQRFEASYIGADNVRHQPIMIHRALFGSVERFMAVLIEHYAGNMPTWLSPEQVRVLGVKDAHDDYAFDVASALRLEGVRVGLDEASEPLGARIRRAKLEKIPYIIVVGDDDVKAGTLGLNARGSNDPERGVTLSEFRERLLSEIVSHGSPEVD